MKWWMRGWMGDGWVNEWGIDEKNEWGDEWVNEWGMDE